MILSEDDASPQISPGFVAGRRGAVPSGVFGPEARPCPPASSVACAMGADSRRRDDGDVPPSPRSGNEEGGDMRRGRSLRCSSSTMLGHRLPPRALISTHETHRRTALGDPAGPRRARSAYSTVRYGAPSALVSHRHQRVSDGLALRRAFGHLALLSAGRAPRGEKTPPGALHRWPQQEAGEICGQNLSRMSNLPSQSIISARSRERSITLLSVLYCSHIATICSSRSGCSPPRSFISAGSSFRL